ncbi:MAG: glycerophosphodiester phosphodiesterase family protein, partial [Flavobacteriales bacterium]|nr:glycerophosphodiester phosphodiesterase family protein [Flavobacteriales bacterium]
QAIGVGGKTEITASFLEQARLSGLEVWQWTVNDPQEMKRLIDLQIDGLITNHPDQALRFITE